MKKTNEELHAGDWENSQVILFLNRKMFILIRHELAGFSDLKVLFDFIH